jgi:hypothetical protein
MAASDSSRALAQVSSTSSPAAVTPRPPTRERSNRAMCLGAGQRTGGELAMTAPQSLTRHDVERATGLRRRGGR